MPHWTALFVPCGIVPEATDHRPSAPRSDVNLASHGLLVILNVEFDALVVESRTADDNVKTLGVHMYVVLRAENLACDCTKKKATRSKMNRAAVDD